MQTSTTRRAVLAGAAAIIPAAALGAAHADVSMPSLVSPVADRMHGLIRLYEEQIAWFDANARTLPDADWGDVAVKTYDATAAKILECDVTTTAAGAVAAIGHVMADDLFNERNEYEGIQRLWHLLKVARNYVAAAGMVKADTRVIADPIFDAIEQSRNAEAEFEDRCSELSAAKTPAADKEYDRLYSATCAAATKLLDVSPTTVAGVTALLKYSAEVVDNGNQLPDLQDQDDKWFPFTCWLESHAADALESIQLQAAA